MFRYIVVPVGRGFCGVAVCSGTVLVTDCGVSLLGSGRVSRTSFRRACRNTERYLSEALGFGGWRGVQWLISHLHYDHYSLMAEYAIRRRLKVDTCYVSAAYSKAECVEALAYIVAFQQLVYEIAGILPVRTLIPKILGDVCRDVKALKQGDTVELGGDVHLHVIWPEITIVTRYCGRVVEALAKLVEEYCRSQERLSERGCMERFKAILGYVRESVNESLSRARLESPLEHEDASHSRDADPQRGNERMKRTAVSTLIRKTTGTRGAFIVRKYREIVSRYANATSVAYAIVVDNYTNRSIDLRIRESLPLTLAMLLSMPIDSNTLILYLADLQNKNCVKVLDRALEYFLNNVVKLRRDPVQVSMVVAPHHGAGWSPLLKALRPRITVISSDRLNGPALTNVKRFCSISPIVVTTGFEIAVEIASLG